MITAPALARTGSNNSTPARLSRLQLLGQLTKDG
jgi:hypothetical protein